MKKMMTLALGLSFLTGSSMFAEVRPGQRDKARNEVRNDKKRQDDRRDRGDRRGAVRDQHADRRVKR